MSVLEPTPHKNSQHLRLLQINNTVLVKVTNDTLSGRALHYGRVLDASAALSQLITLSGSSERELIYRHGYGKVSVPHTPITNNGIIEQVLEKHVLKIWYMKSPLLAVI